jgi:hypothetical protein
MQADTSIDRKPIEINSNSPLVIGLKNLTDKELADVELLNPDFDKQEKIKYSFTGVVNYQEFLLHLRDFSYKVCRCRYITDNLKQTTNSLGISNTDNASTSVAFSFDEELIQPLIVDVRLEGEGFVLAENTKMKLKFLLPNAEVSFIFFPNTRTRLNVSN